MWPNGLARYSNDIPIVAYRLERLKTNEAKKCFRVLVWLCTELKPWRQKTQQLQHHLKQMRCTGCWDKFPHKEPKEGCE